MRSNAVEDPDRLIQRISKARHSHKLVADLVYRLKQARLRQLQKEGGYRPRRKRIRTLQVGNG